ncbi:PIG-L deacetylase family protein [Arthrobacter sp. MDT1-65]
MNDHRATATHKDAQWRDNTRTRLIIAPHADDEVLGCGGLLAKYPEECVVAVCSIPTETRRQEAAVAHALLGHRETHWLELEPDYTGRGLVTVFDDLLDKHQPDEIYLPYPDLHQDHIAVYEAGMRAARTSMKESHWYVRAVFIYHVAAYTAELFPTGLRFDTFEDISGWPVAAKARAMDAYQSETAPPPFPSNGSALLVQAAALGSVHRLEAAEQYAAVRVIR